MTSILLIAAFAVVLTSCHVCLLEPHQRGALSVAQPADDSCFRRSPDCGNIPPGPPTATYPAGRPIHIQFQQNLNHWSQDSPGYIDISVSYDQEKTWQILKSLDDYPGNDMVMQTNFSVPVVFPQEADGPAVLRVRYVSQNPYEIYPANNTDATFYNCADIQISGRDDHFVALESSQDKNPMSPPPLHFFDRNVSCRTPPVWMAEGVSKDGFDRKTNHKIFWDETQAMVRWDRYREYDPDGVFNLSFITNYTLTPDGTVEFGIDYGQQRCTVYGSDKYYPWQYGPQSKMTWWKNASRSVFWMNQRNGFMWSAQLLSDNSCLPEWIKDSNLGEMIFTQAQVVSSIPGNVFNVPKFCNTAQTAFQKQCRGVPRI